MPSGPNWQEYQALLSRVSSLESQSQSLLSRVGNLESQQGVMQTQLDEHEERLSALELPDIPPIPIPGGLVLEDWSDFRLNPAIGEPLWKSYPYPDPDQILSLDGGNLKVTLGAAGRLYIHFHPIPYLFPSGFMQGWIESGEWNDAINRMMFWVKSSISLSGATEWPMSIGTYVKPITDTDPNLQGAHWYHSVTPNWHAGRWMRVILPPKVQGSNSLPGGQEFPLDPLYYSQLTRWYFGDNTSGGIGPFPAGTQWWFSPIELATVTDEPDDLISSIFACYSGTRYEVRFSGPKNVLQRYDVAFHIQSMKQAGFSAGTPAGTVESQQSGYTAIYWNSPAMAEAANFYIAIRPQGQMTFTEIYLPLGGPG